MHRVVEQWEPLKLYFLEKEVEERLNAVTNIVRDMNDDSNFLIYNFSNFTLPLLNNLNLFFQKYPYNSFSSSIIF